MKLNEQNMQIVKQMLDNGDLELTNEQVEKIITYKTHTKEEKKPKEPKHVQVCADGTIAEQLTMDDIRGSRRFSKRPNRTEETKKDMYEYTTGGQIRMLRKTFYKIKQEDLAREFSSMYGRKCGQKDISDIELNNKKTIMKYKKEIETYIGNLPRGEQA